MPFIMQLKYGNTADEKVTLSLAIAMFLSKQVTPAKAAELTKINIREFIGALKSLGISWGEYSEESYLMDELTLSKLAGAK